MARRRIPPARTRVPPHQFWDAPELADTYVPVDQRDQPPRRWCGRCGLVGRPGDERHPLSHEQLLAAAAERDRRILGDRDLAAAA